jgi:hypothetical protein
MLMKVHKIINFQYIREVFLGEGGGRRLSTSTKEILKDFGDGV